MVGSDIALKNQFPFLVSLYYFEHKFNSSTLSVKIGLK